MLPLLQVIIVLAGNLAHSSPPSLPPPYDTPSVTNSSKVKGWPTGVVPKAPPGFKVTLFAKDLRTPRNIFVADDGQVFVSEAGRGQLTQRIRLFRDGKPSDFLTGLNRPYGIEVADGYFYVANQDSVWRYPYSPADTEMKAKGQKILELPAGGYNNHWTRNLLMSRDGKKLYVSVGSASNVAEYGMEHEKRRAGILEINPDGSGERVFASGLRNPVGMAWLPGGDSLWTVVNERDGLGDELVPDYLARVVSGGFYGWPYSYFGKHLDPRLKNPPMELVNRAIVPDVDLGSHTASLGLAFYEARAFPAKYRGGAFIGQHGSWNRSRLSGYRVVFVPFAGGKPSGPPEEFLGGFIKDPAKSEVHGRPVGVAVAKDGSLLVADDGAEVIWRVSYEP